MRCIDCDVRFPGTTFNISCFDSVEEVNLKPVSYFHDTIIIQYHYRLEFYQHARMFLQDMDFITVHKKKDLPYIRYCDVIDAIRGMEMAGAIKPNHHLYLEGIVRVENDRNIIPMYRIQWGS